MGLRRWLAARVRAAESGEVRTGRPPGAPALTTRQAQLALAALVTWVLVWGLRACLLDQDLAQTDNLFGQASHNHRFLFGQGGDLRSLLFGSGYHPPLPSLVATLLASAMGFSPETVRASCLLLHPVVIIQVYRLTRALCPDRDVALFASLLSATVPMIYGWFRCDFPEPLATVFVLATLHAIFLSDLRRPGPAARLGLFVGLGALSKLSFVVFILLPSLQFAATRIRSARQGAMAALALLTALAVCGWWYAQALPSIMINLGLSTSAAQEGMNLSRLVQYIWMPRGNFTLTLAAAAGALVLLDRGVDRWRITLLLLAWGGSYLMFLLLFDSWARYIVPLLPLSCVLAALAWGEAVRLLAPRARAAALGGVALVLLASFTLFNLRAPRDHRQYLGLIVPSTRVLTIYQKLINRLNVQTTVAIVTANSEQARALVTRSLAESGERFPVVVTIPHARKRLLGGEEIFRVHVVRKDVTGRHGHDVNPDNHEPLRWMSGHSIQIQDLSDATHEIRLYIVNASLRSQGW